MSQISERLEQYLVLYMMGNYETQLECFFPNSLSYAGHLHNFYSKNKCILTTWYYFLICSQSFAKRCNLIFEQSSDNHKKCKFHCRKIFAHSSDFTHRVFYFYFNFKKEE